MYTHDATSPPPVAPETPRSGDRRRPRAKGYAAATVDDLCAAAGVTKGSFFHHFKSKEAMVLEAVAHWGTWTDGIFATAPYATHPEVRAACDRGMSSHVAWLARDIEAARLRYAPDAAWTAESVGYFIQAVLQGSFIFAKAKQGPEIPG